MRSAIHREELVQRGLVPSEAPTFGNLSYIGQANHVVAVHLDALAFSASIQMELHQGSVGFLIE